jgi:hypothetical protein
MEDNNSTISIKPETSDIRLAVKLFYHLREQGFKTDWNLTELTSNHFETFCSLRRNLSPEKHALVANFVDLAAEASALDSEDKKIVQSLQFQILANLFAVKSEPALFNNTFCSTDENCGTAIYLNASRINHSCDPNLQASFGPISYIQTISHAIKPNTIVFTALRDILSDEELTISYVSGVMYNSYLKIGSVGCKTTKSRKTSRNF